MILFTALIGPHFVDWTSYRETFEREASAYVGRPVTVAGKAHVRLLPTPVLSFTDVVVGDAEAPDVKMERFSAEVELAPLLKGEVRIIQMAMERPVFHVDLADMAGGRGVFGGTFRLDAERISLERLEIVEGSALVSDNRTGRSWRAEKIDATVEADTLMGPGKVETSFVLDGEPFAVTIGLGRITDGESVVAKAAIRSPNYPVTLSTDGTFHFGGDDPLKYEGNATVVGVEPGDATAPRSPWADFRAAGGFELLPTSLGLNSMQVSYGATERPLVLEASGKLDFADSPRFDISLAARQIDVDRTLGHGADSNVTVEAAVSTLVDKLPQLALPPIPGVLHFDAQSVVVGGSVVQVVSAVLKTADGGWLVDDFAATLPGETKVEAKGTLGILPAPSFTGHARIASRRPTAFAGWWRGEVGSAVNIGRFVVEADIDLHPDDRRFDNLVATTGAGTVTGTVDIKRFPQSDSYFVTVDLGADRADLVETRALAELLVGKTMSAGKIEQMTLSLRADVVSAGGVEARSVVVEGGFEDGELSLRHLSVADLAGASIEAIGSIRDPFGKRSGKVEASIKAEDFRGAADFLASFLPESRLAQHLHRVAPILSPVSAEVSAEAGAAGDKLSLALTGSFADTHLSLDAEGSGSLDDLQTLSGKLKLHADGADSATVLTQLGLNPLPLSSAPLKVDADFDGALAKSGKLSLSGTVAGVDVTYQGETAVSDGKPTTAGAFKAKSKNIDPALLLAGIAVPGVGEGHAASAKGHLDYAGGTLNLTLDEGSFNGKPAGGVLAATFAPELKLSGELSLAAVSVPVLAGFAVGTVPGLEQSGWSDSPFAAALPDTIALDLTLNAASLDVGAPIAATDAKLAFQLSKGKLQLDLDSAKFAGGALKGALIATIGEGQADLTLRGGLQGATLGELIWNRSGLPVASGTLDVAFDTVGRGRSMAGVVATLAGSGSFAVTDGRLNELNPEALTTVMAAAEGRVEPSETKARETFAQLFGSGTLDIGMAEGSFSISNGIMTIPTISLDAVTTAILADATFDLNRFTLGSQWVVRTGEEGAEETQPYVQISFTGKIGDPERRVDLNPLLNLLQSRFLQRQLDELEKLEAARKRIEAEQAARKAEEERRAAEEQQATPDEPPSTGTTPEPSSAPSPIAADPTPAPAQLPPPMQLVPQAAPRPAAPQPQERPATSAPTLAPVTPLPEYRTLPNGTIVKTR